MIVGCLMYSPPIFTSWRPALANDIVRSSRIE